jgi:hypothetical protein
MAKATQHGASVWLPAGAEPPPDLPDSVRLTGPGGAAAEQRRKKRREATAKVTAKAAEKATKDTAVEESVEGEPDVLWICKGCGTSYSVDAPRCPQCGSIDHVEQGSAEDPAREPAEEGTDYDALTVDQLRDELGERGLPKSGNKAELVLRLQADDLENARPADAQGEDGTSH